MSQLARFGVSLEQELLDAFDAWSQRKGYANRSEALRHLIRKVLHEEQMEDPDAQVAGVLSLIYDHHEKDLPRRLTAMQHDAHEAVLASLHVHLDLHNCLEIMALRGKSSQVRGLADRLESAKGVSQGHLCLASVDFEPPNH